MCLNVSSMLLRDFYVLANWPDSKKGFFCLFYCQLGKNSLIAYKINIVPLMYHSCPQTVRNELHAKVLYLG